MTAPVEARVTDLQLERFRLGELPPEEMDALRERLTRDEALRARLDALTASDAEFAARYPAREVAGPIRQRVADAAPQTVRRPSPLWRFAPLAAAAAILLAVWIPMSFRPDPGPRDEGDIRLKGGPSLVLYRRLPDGSERLKSGDRARQGDQVRIAYNAAGHAYGVILSVDRTGVVTRHLPAAASAAAAMSLQGGGAVMLDSAYELDAAPGWERFYLVTADRAFDIAPIEQAVREVAGRGSAQAPPRLALGKELAQAVFTLTKDDHE